jgi:hypothetical protein
LRSVTLAVDRVVERRLPGRAGGQAGDDVGVGPLDLRPRSPLERATDVVEAARSPTVGTRVIELRHDRNQDVPGIILSAIPT